MTQRNDSGDTGRRGFLRVIGLGTAAVGASSLLTPGASGLEARTGDATIPSPVGGSDEPYPIPWWDKNGSHNQATTDNSFMDGECWTPQRRVRTGSWAHL